MNERRFDNLKQFNMNTTKIKDEDGNWSSLPSIKGESAYELAVRKGFEGSEDDYNDLTNKKFKQVNEDILKLSTKIYNSEIVENTSGEILSLDDHIENYGFRDCKLYGRSKQETTTGAQLFPTITPSTEVKSGITVEYMEHGKIHISGTAEKTVDFMTPTFELLAGTYTLSMGVNIDNALMRCTLNTAEGLPFFDILNNGASKTETTTDNMELYLLLRVYGGKTIDLTIQPMLNASTSPLPWEPYTGGQPSPSPDYPQEIVSAGSDGKIGIEVRGKNLVDIYGYSASDIPSPEAERVLFNTYGTTLSTTEKTDKLIVNQKIIDGASVNNYTSGYFCIGINRKLEAEKDYIITFNIDVIQNPLSASAFFILFNGIEAHKTTIIGDKVTVKAKNIEYRERQYVEVRTCGMSMEISNFMITEKDENTIYEPYHEPQSLSISTPTGLPAIPVDTGGNYTDADGQQWISDYVDLKRGKYVKNVNTCVIDASTNVFKIGREGIYWNLPSESLPGILKGIGIGSKYPIFPSKYFARKVFNANTKYSMLYTNGDNMKGLFNSIEELNTFCKERYDAGDPVVFYYAIDPIERDLTASEIQAYKNLVTYAGTTIVENDADCHMELGYVADPKAYIDKKFSELSSAIIASASEAE